MKKEFFLTPQWFFAWLMVAVFLGFGLFRLAQFETVDEHFWKYERIQKYWNGIREWKLKKTAINDKPGVTVAIFSGFGLLFTVDPKTNQQRDPKITENGLYKVYNSAITEEINFALRLPVLLVITFLLLVVFLLLTRIFSPLPALGVFSLITLSPILVGISRIINPDAFLWIFGTITLFSYIVFVGYKEMQLTHFGIIKNFFLYFVTLVTLGKRKEQQEEREERKKKLFGGIILLWISYKYPFLIGTTLGLALLSKYTANLLYPLMLIILFFVAFFCRWWENQENFIIKIRTHLWYFFVITIISWITFCLFLPATWIDGKYFLRGTIASPVFEAVGIPVLIGIFFIVVDSIFLRGRILSTGMRFLWPIGQTFFIRLPAIFFLFTSIFLLYNSWTGEVLLPLQDRLENARQKGEMTYDMITTTNVPLAEYLKFAVNFYPLVFSLLPVVLITFLLLWFKQVIFGAHKYTFLIAVGGWTIILYIFGALASDVLINYRYAILLYPIFALTFIASTLDLWDFVIKKISKKNVIKEYQKNTKIFSYWLSPKFSIIRYLPFALLSICSLFALVNSAPHYFNYTSPLLPKPFIANDSWGYGSYEVAQYINNLPNADKIVIWSDRLTICQFLKGRCVANYKIDISKITPDYFVYTRRGMLRHRFQWENGQYAKHSTEYYYSKEVIDRPAFRYNILGRENNYWLVIPADER